MTVDATKLIDIYEHLFAEPGWKELVEDLKEKVGNLKTAVAEGNSTFDQVQFTRGLIAGYKYFIGLEGYVEKYKAQQHEGLPNVVE